jgi:hypothetical protein
LAFRYPNDTFAAISQIFIFEQRRFQSAWLRKAMSRKVISNMAIVPTLNGSINSFAANPTQLILDLSGYFAP